MVSAICSFLSIWRTVSRDYLADRWSFLGHCMWLCAAAWVRFMCLKRWLHFIPLCVSLIGGHFLPGPHVDLLIWCVAAGRLGGVLVGQINCLSIFCSSKCHNAARDSRAI